MARYAGMGTFIMGLLAFFSRGVEDDKAKRAVTFTLLIANAVGVVISAVGMISGVIGATGWVVIGFYLFFVIGYAYFHFK